MHWLTTLECHAEDHIAEDHIEGERIRAVTGYQPLEAEYIISPTKSVLKELLYGPTLNSQQCDSKIAMSSRLRRERRRSKPAPFSGIAYLGPPNMKLTPPEYRKLFRLLLFPVTKELKFGMRVKK